MVGRARRFPAAGSAEPAARVAVPVALSPWSGLLVFAQLPLAVVVLALPPEFPAIAAGLSTAVLLGAIDVSGSKPIVKGNRTPGSGCGALCIVTPSVCVLTVRSSAGAMMRMRYAITVQVWVSAVCLGLYTV